MLVLEPFWVYASVSFCVTCGRRQLSRVESVWGNVYFSYILILITAVFAPVENWVLHRNTDWESSFLLEKISDSSVIALASLIHILSALLSYSASMYLLRRHGQDAVLKSAIWSFSIFFLFQGLFYDSLMYSGTYDEFHAGIPKSYWSFFYSSRFFDAYIVFFLFYGPPFYGLAIFLNNGCTKAEHEDFLKKLKLEAVKDGSIICSVYVFLYILGILPDKFDLWRLVPMMTMHIIPHSLLLLPLHLCKTKEKDG